MTDFRALCAELADSIELLLEMRPVKAKPLQITEDRLARARAALSETQPEPPTDGEVVELVAWLLEGGEDAAANGWDHQARQFARAAELLQHPQPEPEGPTDEELDELAWNWYSKTGSTWWQIDAFRAFARAVLARWGK